MKSNKFMCVIIFFNLSHNIFSLNELTADIQTLNDGSEKSNTAEIEPNFTHKSKIEKCSISSDLMEEIRSYQNVTNLIIDTVLNGEFKGKTYEDLDFFVSKFPGRYDGTKILDNSIDYMIQFFENEKLENVHAEEAKVPHWVRGEESAEIIFPIRKKILISGLGFSVGTPQNGIEAEVLVVKNFKELQARATEARGKIIVYNYKYKGYFESFVYRFSGASEAAKVGAIGALIKSDTPFSTKTPQTGRLEYQKNVKKIPAASIIADDAKLFSKLQEKGLRVVVNLKMNAENLPFVKSRNVIAEITGNKLPNEIIVLSGHIDSWDVGQGAMDDGGGVFISAEALLVLKFLNLRPRRTLRTIIWTGEEMGYYGGKAYLKSHESELDNFKTVFESDYGTFRPLGFDFLGSSQSACILAEILKLFRSINTTKLRTTLNKGFFSEASLFYDKGVPAISLYNANKNYFYYHHSVVDTINVENGPDLDLCTALWTAAGYILADLSIALPRDK